MFTAVRLNAQTYPPVPEELHILQQAGIQVTCVEGQQPEEIVAAAQHADALLIVSAKVPGHVLEQLPKLRVASRLGAGTDRIDIEAATRLGIVVANVPDFCLGEQADHTLLLLLAAARQLPYMQAAVHRFEWDARLNPSVHRLSGKVLGLVGFGSSAQQVAIRARAFGLRIVAWARSPAKYARISQELGVRLTELDSLLEQSDFVSLQLPLVPETHHLLHKERLALFKPTAWLINTARGALVDERALVHALANGQLAGAALDVFEELDVFAPRGTPAAHPLLALPNVILTPHCAGSSVESTHESTTRGAQHVVQVLNGVWPPHVVNSGVVPRWPLRAGAGGSQYCP